MNGRYFSAWLPFFLVIFIVSTATTGMAVTKGVDALGLHWLKEITEETIQEEYGTRDAGKMGPYLQQLAKIRQAALVGNRSKISEGIDNFLNMLASKQNGISAKTATRLYDITYEVVPARYVDSERFRKQYEKDIKPYMEKFREDMG